MEEDKKSQSDLSNNKLAFIAGAVLLLILAGGYAFLSGAFTAVYTVTLAVGPKEVDIGKPATFTWRVDGPATTIKHTAVYFGTESTPGELGKEVKPSDTKYTDFVKDFADGKFNIPLQFVGNAYLSKKGKYFYRVHAEVGGKNYWTPEYTFEVKPIEYKVALVQAPNEVAVKTVSTFTWRVDGEPTTIDSTSIYFGLESVPGELGKEVKPSDTKYKYSIPDFIKGSYNIPLQFVGNIKVNAPGTYYYRVHANINGENYWTNEQSFVAK